MFCSNCGKQLDDGSIFCGYCGAPTAAAAPAHPGQATGTPPPAPPDSFYQGQPTGTPQGYGAPPGYGAGPGYQKAKNKNNMIDIAAVCVVLVAALAVTLVLLLRTGAAAATCRPGSIVMPATVQTIMRSIETILSPPGQAATPQDSGAAGQDNESVPSAAVQAVPEEDQVDGAPVTGSSQPAEDSAAPSDEQPPAGGYSTAERPDVGDFAWFLEGVFFDGLPADRAPITDYSEITGGWKAYIWYDPDNRLNSMGWEFLNIIVEGDADDVSVTFDRYIFHYDDTDYPQSDADDTVLSGKFEQSEITAGYPERCFT
jgi:hypothetical protein